MNISQWLSDIAYKTGLATSFAAGDAQIGLDVYLGKNLTIYPKVNIGAASVILDGAVLGRPPIANRTINQAVRTEFSDLTIEESAMVGCNAVLYTGSRLGKNVLIGDLASVREGCKVGEGTIIGRGAMVLSNCTIGKFVRIQDQAHIVGDSLIEDHVFIAMGVMTSNDNDIYLTRLGHAKPKLSGPVIRRLAVLGVGATILPGVEIGMGAMVAAGAVVTKNVAAWTVVAGSPARFVRNVPEDWRLSAQRFLEDHERS